LGKDLADEVQPRKMLYHPCYQEENSHKFNYKLHNHILQPVDNSKYLGVTISNELDWGPHINNITTKANKTWERSYSPTAR
jgi:hypothetical protein